MPIPAPCPAGRPHVPAQGAGQERSADSAATSIAENDRVLREVRRVLGTLLFGSVTLIVQDGRVVQVETTSKVRLGAGGNGVKRGG